MIVTQAVWDKVHIKWDEPVPRHNAPDTTEEELSGVRIFFKQAGEYTTTVELLWGKDNHMLLTKAKLIELTPWSAKFEAYWWSSPLPGGRDETTLIRGDITCEF